ncbi:hypothetical protein NLJ89_g3956 [Agrocybe chaxingu]|uniref:Uncharacterized protein n=1 Tax=Agrocybe chaxingu TaxID=84603 RepID=A0A9W8MWE5_9AGAR|nr:hypothetical protein NLJ89_g3956 [Agrocybe chaxingu]
MLIVATSTPSVRMEESGPCVLYFRYDSGPKIASVELDTNKQPLTVGQCILLSGETGGATSQSAGVFPPIPLPYADGLDDRHRLPIGH